MTVQNPEKRRRRKRYALDQSPFYKLESKGRLADVLGLPLRDLQELASSTSNYNFFTLDEKTDITGRTKKARSVQQPKGDLAKVHKRLLILLSRVEVPEYLHSAVRGKSYISNARQHIGPLGAIKVDLRNFYPSTKRHHIFGFFNREMYCSEDAAMLLARICTVNESLPTGSPISTHLSFFAHRAMFEEIAALAAANELKFSVYVDDLVLSGAAATPSILRAVERIVRRHQLSVRSEKSKVFRPGRSKVITGVVVDGDGIHVPHGRHKKIRLLEEALVKRAGLLSRLPVLERLVGVLGEASQIELRFLPKLAKHVVSLNSARALRASLQPPSHHGLASSSC